MKADVPIGLEITSIIGCPVNCVYCIANEAAKAYQGARRFTLESFRKCIEGGEVPVGKNLTFMGQSEGFNNHDHTSMILWAMKERGHGGSWSTTLQGITHEQIDALAGLDPTDTVIHCPGADSRMPGLIVDDKYLDLFKHAIAAWRHHREFVLQVFAPSDVHQSLRPIFEKEGFPIPQFALHGRAGQIPGLATAFHHGPLPLCSKRWSGSLLPNGDLVRCCNDMLGVNVWGNLFRDKYAECFRTPAFRAYMNACGSEDDDVPCRHCVDSYRQTNAAHKHLSYENPLP